MTPPPRKPYLPKPFLPRIMPRTTIWEYLLFLLLLLLCALLFTRTIYDIIAYMALLVLTTPLLAISIRGMRTMFRNAKRIRELNGRVCPWCLYDLSALPPDGRCPECSTRYEDDDLRAYWRTTTK